MEDNNLLPKCEDFTTNGKCSKCGECCSNLLPLTNKEIKRLRYLVKKRNLKPYTRVSESTNVFGNTYDMTCPFLNKENKCEVYEDRPYICRTFMCNKKELTNQDIKKMINSEPIDLRKVIFKEK